MTIASHAQPPLRRRWFVLAMLCTAFFTVVTDSTSVFTALPSLWRCLHSSGVWLPWACCGVATVRSHVPLAAAVRRFAIRYTVWYCPGSMNSLRQTPTAAHTDGAL